MDEQRRVEEASPWYVEEQLDFDKRLIRFRHASIRPYLAGERGLELGPADGQMTRLLLDDFASLTVVDAAQSLLDRIADDPRLRKVCALFETYEPDARFDTVVLDHVLEHVDDPVGILRRVAGWVAGGGRMIVGVPNADSIHRLAAVKMGLLGAPTDLNDRDRTLGHRRVYTIDALRRDLDAAGLVIEHVGGTFLKPVSARQIEDTWDDAMIEGFYELGKDLPHLAAELFAVCRVGSEPAADEDPAR